jgi:hypothetical protein
MSLPHFDARNVLIHVLRQTADLRNNSRHHLATSLLRFIHETFEIFDVEKHPVSGRILRMLPLFFHFDQVKGSGS